MFYQELHYRAGQTAGSGAAAAWEVPRKCPWTQALVWHSPWFSDRLPLLEATPEGKLPQLTSLRGVCTAPSLATSATETLHCREKSSPRIPEHPERSCFTREGARTPPHKRKDPAPLHDPRGSHEPQRKHLKHLTSPSPTTCQLDPRMHLQGLLFHWECWFCFPVFRKELGTQLLTLPSRPCQIPWQTFSGQEARAQPGTALLPSRLSQTSPETRPEHHTWASIAVNKPGTGTDTLLLPKSRSSPRAQTQPAEGAALSTTTWAVSGDLGR